MRTANSELGFTIDIERMGIPSIDLDGWKFAFEFLNHLEAGAIANPDEGRWPKHAELCLAWLRSVPELRRTDIPTAVQPIGLALHRTFLPLPSGAHGLEKDQPGMG